MKFVDLLRALSALAPHATNTIDIDNGSIGEACDREVRADAAFVRSLFEERAGFVPAEDAQNAEYRLANPRLLTTLPAERTRALESRRLKSGDEVGKLLPAVVEAIVKLSLVDAELANERHRSEQMWNAGRRREALGIYPQVETSIDMLYNGYGITRWHWAAATDEQLRDIAAILLRNSWEELVVLDRNQMREGSDD